MFLSVDSITVEEQSCRLHCHAGALYPIVGLQLKNDSSPQIDELVDNLKIKAKITGKRVLREPVWQGAVQIGSRGEVEFNRLMLAVVRSPMVPSEGTTSVENETVSYGEAADLKAEGAKLYKNGDPQVRYSNPLLSYLLLLVLSTWGYYLGVEWHYSPAPNRQDGYPK